MWANKQTGFSCRGMALFSSALLLLILATLVTGYVAKVKSLENQIVNNEQSRKQAMNAASTGLYQALATLQVRPDWVSDGSDQTLTSGSQFAMLTTDFPITPGSSSYRGVAVMSVGTSADGLTQANVSADAIVYPILARVPPVPVMIGGGASALSQASATGSSLTIGSNINGAGQGMPLSVWTSATLSSSQSSITSCLPANFSAAGCNGNLLSSGGNKGTDILDADNLFPADLWQYAFNLTTSQALSLKQEASIIAADCSGLSSQSTGMIWITGDCVIAPGITLGSINEPVLLVVVNGNLSLQASACIHGMVFWASLPAGSGAYQLIMGSGTTIEGALLSNQQIDTASTDLRVVYEPAALRNLQLPPFTRVAMVPGSWRDF
ncbi:hypothetical protein [Alteromonas sp. AMM-1]|uniref:hypothetical protein n=1 Tax=Alteromonas sp. AMM-1 TaxID=3394233 RepID=UPI0039A5CD7D